jgi:hypothetical protein
VAWAATGDVWEGKEVSEAPNAELNGGCLQPSDLSAELGAGG